MAETQFADPALLHPFVLDKMFAESKRSGTTNTILENALKTKHWTTHPSIQFHVTNAYCERIPRGEKKALRCYCTNISKTEFPAGLKIDGDTLARVKF